MRCEVVVAGGGVSGLLLARALASAHDVILIEQRPEIPRAKYWLTDDLSAEQNPELSAAIDCHYRHLDFLAYDSTCARIHGTYVLWDTDKLIAILLEDTRTRGARILTGHRLYAYRHIKRGIVIRANALEIEAKLLVDCMGFASPIVSALGTASILGYFILTGQRLLAKAAIDPVGLHNVMLQRTPTYLELFPTKDGFVDAAMIIPARSFNGKNTLAQDFQFVVRSSHYSALLDFPEPNLQRRYYGIIPVGKVKRVALDRIVFAGEAGQCNPATSATCLTRMLVIHHQMARRLSENLHSGQLSARALTRGHTQAMTAMNRLFQEELFKSLLDASSIQFKRLVEELHDQPDELVNDLIFARHDFGLSRSLRIGIGALKDPRGWLGVHTLRSVSRRLFYGGITGRSG